eukprot:jgi/Chlat1/8512/Chrsp80S00640
MPDEGEEGLRVEAAYIGVGCNRVAHAAAWGSRLVAFGAHNAVALYDPQKRAIVATLPGHTSRVNAVRWLKLADGDELLLSGSVDTLVNMWRFTHATTTTWEQEGTLRGHEAGVEHLATIALPTGRLLLASTSIDCTTRVWQSNSKGAWELFQTVSVRGKLMQCAALAQLPAADGVTVLALAGVDRTIHILTDASGQFVSACELHGHTDWVRSLSFVSVLLPLPHLLLASGSQDRSVRVWKIESVGAAGGTDTEKATGFDFLKYTARPVFSAGGSKYTAGVEAVLAGHEDWVHTVCWQPRVGTDQPVAVLSASMDRTMNIWRPSSSGLWMSEVRVGEAGANVLGYYGGVFSPTGDCILAHGHTGAFHLWRNLAHVKGDDDWAPQLSVGGHFAPVTDITWDRFQRFLLSVSHDQTARIVAEWHQPRDTDGDSPAMSWHEIARPQVHGHDINCVAYVSGDSAWPQRFMSGADEKVGRIFHAPATFVRSLANISGSPVNQAELDGDMNGNAVGANLPALGLSNKPLYADSPAAEPADSVALVGVSDYDGMPNATPLDLTEPPLEEHLAQNTLWPELQKLYGHGNELYSACADHAGRLIATACKAQSVNVADIWLWETSTWQSVGQMPAHTLTVTQMEFSPDDSLLVSVSRDRQLALHRKSSGKGCPYELACRVKGHDRIIWSVSWAPNGQFFATGSRDKKVKLWRIDTSSEGDITTKAAVTLPMFASSVTAVAFAPQTDSNAPVTAAHMLAVGLESGEIELWRVAQTADAAAAAQLTTRRLLAVKPHLRHVAAVHRLRWRVVLLSEGSFGALQLASCSADHSVRLFDVT